MAVPRSIDRGPNREGMFEQAGALTPKTPLTVATKLWCFGHLPNEL